jgi:hypothetical protein
VGIVFGWIFAAHQLGAATAAYSAGVARTFFGTYQQTFITAGLICLLASGMVIRIGRTSRKPAMVAPAPVPEASGVA